MEKIYASEPNALQVNISGLKPKVKLNDSSMKLREEKNNLQKLFKSSIDSINICPKRIVPKREYMFRMAHMGMSYAQAFSTGLDTGRLKRHFDAVYKLLK